MHAMRRPSRDRRPPAALLEVSIRKAAPPWAAYCVGQREAGRYHRTDPRSLGDAADNKVHRVLGHVLLAEEPYGGGLEAAGYDAT
jgi:hypothetical protein